ncbi:MAG: biotin--[acetyl-CoA-carboxylase] ligase [Solirubrobacteraceae bacterium]
MNAREQGIEPRARLGQPRLHTRRIDSTNERARTLAIVGAPHGTLVSSDEQTAGRGRQGRSWLAPPGSSLLCSLVLRDPPALLSLIAGVAVCDAVGGSARVKWPNDVVMVMDDNRLSSSATPTALPSGESSPASAADVPVLTKLAGILVEGRPQENWAVLGIGLNVAVRIQQLPSEVGQRAASLELSPSAIEPTMQRLLDALENRFAEPVESVLDAWRERDALLHRDVSWGDHRSEDWAEQGRAEGIDNAGRLVVKLGNGSTTALDAGEVHLGLSY